VKKRKNGSSGQEGGKGVKRGRVCRGTQERLGRRGDGETRDLPIMLRESESNNKEDGLAYLREVERGPAKDSQKKKVCGTNPT